MHSIQKKSSHKIQFSLPFELVIELTQAFKDIKEKFNILAWDFMHKVVSPI